MKNVSAFTEREILNQNTITQFRTSQLGSSSNYISGNGGTLNFHASGFTEVANIQQLIFNGMGDDPTSYDIEFFMISSNIISERQYYYTSINTRIIHTPSPSIILIDNNNSNCLHGKITNNSNTSGMWLNYIEIRYNRMLKV